MTTGPVGKDVRCPRCNAIVTAIVPQKSRIVQREENSDGKVRVNCKDCGERFLAYFRTET